MPDEENKNTVKKISLKEKIVSRLQNCRNWVSGRKGWIFIIGISIAQGIFASILLMLRVPEKEVIKQKAEIRAMAIDMLGHEVKITNINDIRRIKGNKTFAVVIDIAIVLGELESEREVGVVKPTAEEFAEFVEVVTSLEDNIRDKLTVILQNIPLNDFFNTEVFDIIKPQIKEFINNELVKINYNKVRPQVDKKRVTEIFITSFLRQYL